MKTKLFIYFILFFLVFINSILKAETVFFDSKNIKIEEEGNMIFATNGTAKIPSSNLIIKGEKFIYDKRISELTILDNVKYFDQFNDIYIESEKLIYNEIENKVYSKSETYIEIEKLYKINSYDVLFDRNINEIVSNNYTTINDDDKNNFIFDNGLVFDVIEEIVSSKEVKISDKNSNEYFFENSKINLKINEIVGKEIFIDFKNDFFGDKNNDPVLKGKGVKSNNESTKIYKTVFSTCNKLDKSCRGWEIQSELFTHNKIKRIFEYEKSWLKVFDKKVFFMPYFNHPDPSVKRKSGFLTPFYKGSDNLGSSFSVPYFYAISKSKDLTLKPRIYLNNEYIFHNEYREAFKNSDLIADFSFNTDANSSNTHLFVDLVGDIDDKTEYEVSIQSVSNDNYFKIHDIKDYTKIITSDSSLKTYVSIDRDIDNDTNFNSSFIVYEDLSQIDSDKYQYIFPNFNFSKEINIDKSYNGQFDFLSSGFQKVYDTNKYEALINNDFNFNSFDFFSSRGVVTDYSLLLKNYNTYSENSLVYENKNDHEIFGTLLVRSEFPLKKKLNNSNNFIKPIIQGRFSPTNGKDISSNESILLYDNIFSPNRIGRSDMVEKGTSLTLGIEFEKQNLKNEKMLGFNLGNVIKNEKNSDLPTKSKLDQTRSDIIGNFYYNMNEYVEFNYNFSYDRDLNFSNYDAITATFGVNNLITTFDYITENHEIGNTETIKNNTEFKFTDEHSINIDTTKDLKDDFTQFIKLSYEYETDCLLASFQYEKKFFRDDGLLPDESLYFLIRFIPFAELRGSANTIFEKKNENK